MNEKPEFSFFVNCDNVKEAEKTFNLEANDEQRAALAKRLNLLSLDILTLKAVVARTSSHLVQVQCDCHAELVQQCVITANPLEVNINFSFDRSFSNRESDCYGGDVEPAWDMETGASESLEDAPEPPDFMRDGGFDLGECAAEQLLLEIDPFPRAADANFDGISSAGAFEDSAGEVSPFAILEQLKKKS